EKILTDQPEDGHRRGDRRRLVRRSRDGHLGRCRGRGVPVLPNRVRRNGNPVHPKPPPVRRRLARANSMYQKGIRHAERESGEECVTATTEMDEQPGAATIAVTSPR